MRPLQQDAQIDVKVMRDPFAQKSAMVLISFGAWSFEIFFITTSHLGWRNLTSAAGVDQMIVLLAYLGPWAGGIFEWYSAERLAQRDMLGRAAPFFLRRSILKVLWPTYIAMTLAYCFFLRPLAK